MNTTKTFFVFILNAVVFISGCSENESTAHLPNIVYLLPDDMGIGDLTC